MMTILFGKTRNNVTMMIMGMMMMVKNLKKATKRRYGKEGRDRKRKCEWINE